MTRSRRALLAILVVAAVLALGGCGKAGAPAPADTIATWAARVGVAPDLVYVTDLDGFALATQSVGVSGDNGMSAAYVKQADGSTVLLRTGRASDPAVVACAELSESAQQPLRCAVQRGAAQVTLEGDGVEAGVLRTAGDAVRVPSEKELKRLFGDLPAAPQGTIERGDLPPGGDGAPMDSPGEGG